MNTHRRLLLVAACLGFFAASGACRRPEQTNPAAAAKAAPAPAVKLSKVVFVGKEHACDCTRRAVDASWAALEAALGTPARVPVEKMHVDTEAARVEPYRIQRPIMALPVIYFVDGKGAVLDVLQGEVTDAQIQPVLGKLQ